MGDGSLLCGRRITHRDFGSSLVFLESGWRLHTTVAHCSLAVTSRPSCPWKLDWLAPPLRYKLPASQCNAVWFRSRLREFPAAFWLVVHALCYHLKVNSPCTKTKQKTAPDDVQTSAVARVHVAEMTEAPKKAVTLRPHTKALTES